MSKDIIEKLRYMADSDRLRKSASDLLEELDADGVRTLAEALDNLASKIDAAKGYVEEWACAEDREERMDARERAIESIEELCNVAEWDVGEAECPDWIIRELTEKRMGEEAV